MNFSSCMLISIFLASICTVIISGESANSKKKSSKKEEKQLFIDDLEGSGFEPDTKTDMVYSGSGYGPDDEDAPLNPSPDMGTKTRTQDLNEKAINNANSNVDNKEDKHEQTLPMPMPKSTATPTISTRAPEPPSIEINTKPQETEIAPKVLIEKQPESKTDIADKSPVDDNNNNNNGVYVVNTPNGDRTTSFFAQPGILAAVIGGAVVGLLCAILVVMFIVYRMRKKDEGSYPLEDMKRCPATNPYIKPNHREFFA